MGYMSLRDCAYFQWGGACDRARVSMSESGRLTLIRFLGVVVSSSLAAALRARFLLGVADSGVLLAEAPTLIKSRRVLREWAGTATSLRFK